MLYVQFYFLSVTYKQRRISMSKCVCVCVRFHFTRFKELN